MPTLTAVFARLAEAQAETQAIVLRVRRTSAALVESAALSRKHIAESQAILRRVSEETRYRPTGAGQIGERLTRPTLHSPQAAGQKPR
jgi:hypothetical protein